MKKIIAIMLVLMVCFVFITGCSDDNSTDQESGETDDTQLPQQEAEPTDSVPQPPALPEE